MAAIIIPARWGSTRFPGKPLALIAGKPLIQRVWEQCQKSRHATQVIVATDDMRIAEAAFDFGAEVALTKPNHPSGTDRVAEVAALLQGQQIIVNVQGDEPFVDPRLIDRLILLFQKYPKIQMATAASPILNAQEFADPNIVKVVVSPTGQALYFSRSPIPNDRDAGSFQSALRHQGIYAYSKKFLLEFVKWKPTPLERVEKLEQLRALEHHAVIQIIKTRHSAQGVDTPEQAELASQSALVPTGLAVSKKLKRVG